MERDGFYRPFFCVRSGEKENMRLCSIASGSSGNCIYVGEKNTHILVDAGISAKRILEGLKKVSVLPGDLSAIFITHEHSDHVQGLWTFFMQKFPCKLCGRLVREVSMRSQNTLF